MNSYLARLHLPPVGMCLWKLSHPERFAPPMGGQMGEKKRRPVIPTVLSKKKGPDPNVIPNGNYMDWMQVLVGVHWLVINQSPCCGAKHISKSKCTKHTMLGTLWKLRCRKKCTPLWREAHFEVKMHKAPQLRSTLIEVAMSKKCTPLWREAHFEVKMYKAPQLRNTLRSCDVEKVHAVVARNTFRSQNVQNTPCSEHFGSCDVQKVHAVVARSTFRSQNVQNTPCYTLWKLRCRKSARRCGAKHISKSKC